LSISKYNHSFHGIFTKHFPTTTLAPALKVYLTLSFTHNAIIDTTLPPPFVNVLRTLQEINLSSLMEHELAAVVAVKIREFINIETRADWTRRYTAVLADWVENGLAELLRWILGRRGGEGVGSEALKTVALRALTELRIHELFDIIKEFPESMCAIEDLKMCIETPEQRDHLVSVFRLAYWLQFYLSDEKVCKTTVTSRGGYNDDYRSVHIHHQSFSNTRPARSPPR
jgi:hypothetical protein